MSTPLPPLLLDQQFVKLVADKIVQQFKRKEIMDDFVDQIIREIKHGFNKRRKLNKDDVVTFTTHFTQLSLTARAHYQNLIEEARTCITQNNFDELRKHLLPKIRQICIHFNVVKHDDEDEDEDEDLTSVQFEHQDVSTNLNLQSILTTKVLQEKDQCSICLSTPTHVLITKCTHIFCRNCIKKWFDRPKKPVECPCCRGLLTIDDMFSETRPDTKLEILMKLLKEDTSTNSKSIIFSRYHDALYYFYNHLHNAGFNVLINTKTMKHSEDKIKNFENMDEPVVWLMDFEITRKQKILINAPCRVFILDACRKSTEEELVARVTKPVCVSRLISQNTIEDKIVSLNLKERFAKGRSFDFYDKWILTYLLKEEDSDVRRTKRVIRKPTYLDLYDVTS